MFAIVKEESGSLGRIGLIEGVDGYHYDIMSIQDIDFGSNEIIVNNPKHNFAGYE